VVLSQNCGTGTRYNGQTLSENKNSCFPYLQDFVLTIYERLNQPCVLLRFRQEDISSNVVRAVASRGASCARTPHLKSVTPHFTFGPPVAAYIQYCILKMLPPLLAFGPPFWFLAPPSGFWPPLQLNPGDGPECDCDEFKSVAVRI